MLWQDAIPPQASPNAPAFSAGAEGEWSDVTISTSPARRRRHSSSCSVASRTGGAHLATAPSVSTSSGVRNR